jgi:hypothetical protein
MDYPPIRIEGNPLFELVDEIATFKVKKSRLGRGGEKYDYDIIRAIQHDQSDTSNKVYSDHMEELINKVTPEVISYPKGQIKQILVELEPLKERLVKANSCWFSHKFMANFNSAQFEREFYRLFSNHPDMTFSEGLPDFGDLKTTKHFWKDVEESVMIKYVALTYVTGYLSDFINSSEVYIESDPSPSLPIQMGISFPKLYFSKKAGVENLLYEVLKPYIDSQDHQKLKMIIGGIQIQGKLQYTKKSGKSLAKIVAFFNEKGFIFGNPHEQAMWILSNFTYPYKDKPTDFKLETILYNFREKGISLPAKGEVELVKAFESQNDT